MSIIILRCSSCKNIVKKSDGTDYGTCKAFPKGIIHPYGIPPSSYDGGISFQEPEISIREHRIFTPIQENNYLYEDKNIDPYQLVGTLSGLYYAVHTTLYWSQGTQEQAIELMEKFWKDTINIDKQKAFEWALNRNQSLEAKNLLEYLFRYEAERDRRKKLTEAELMMEGFQEPQESTELLANRMFWWIETYGLPDDFYILYTDEYTPYIYDFLRFDFTSVLYDLGEVSMQNKAIEVLPDNVGELVNARFLNVSCNQLQVLPPAIGKLRYLERLDVYGNQLETLPDELCNLLQMNRLDLYHNILSVLPNNIGRLANLQWLGLNHNRLTSLPDSLVNLQKLEGLYCTDNQFTVFPLPVTKLESLKYLYLSGNQLQSIPTEISQLKNLRWLGLARNQLTALPDSLSVLPCLEWLDISGNPLQSEEIEKIKKLMPQVEVVYA
jgi:hypothetical protein